MIEIKLGVHDLARVRISSDAVWETTASLEAIAFPRRHALHRRLRARVPPNPRYDLALLLELVGDPNWVPDSLGPIPRVKPASALGQLDGIRATSLDVAEADLDRLRRTRPQTRAATMSAGQYLESVAAAMAGYWRDVLAPLWERVDAIVGADIAHHSALLASQGLAATIPALHEEMSYAEGTVAIQIRANDTIAASGDGMWFVPSVFLWPWVAVGSAASAPVVSYAARGAGLIWEGRKDQADGLTALLGRSRAAILAELDIPRTTTSLAARLRLAPATVSSHLSVLTSSGLLAARREGRRVLYSRTAMANQLLRTESARARSAGTI